MMMSIRVRHSLHLLVLLAVSAVHSTVFALSSAERRPHPPAVSSRHSHLTYDEVSARVPREIAPIASVAVAQVNIAMHRARQLAELRLCAGHWTPQGAILFEVGPLFTPSAAAGDDDGAWHYQAFRQPEALFCGDITRARFFEELSRHLPHWIMIRPAGQTTAFRQGIAVALP